MKSAAKNPKAAFRSGRGEYAWVGGWAASATASSEPVPAALSLRSLICARMSARSVAACSPRLPSSAARSWLERGASAVKAAALGPPLRVQERGGDGVRDSCGP